MNLIRYSVGYRDGLSHKEVVYENLSSVGEIMDAIDDVCFDFEYNDYVVDTFDHQMLREYLKNKIDDSTLDYEIAGYVGDNVIFVCKDEDHGFNEDDLEVMFQRMSRICDKAHKRFMALSQAMLELQVNPQTRMQILEDANHHNETLRKVFNRIGEALKQCS